MTKKNITIPTPPVTPNAIIIYFKPSSFCEVSFNVAIEMDAIIHPIKNTKIIIMREKSPLFF